MLRTGLFFDAYSASKLFTASTLSPFSSLEYARKMFDEIPEPNLYTWNTLIRAYSWSPEPSESVKIFLPMLSYRVFVRIGEKDVVSWNSMISGFVQGGCFDKALELFREMEAENVKPNAVTMVGVLSACTKMKDLGFGRWIHLYIEQNGIKMDLTLSNAMLDIQETATWNALISARDQNGKPHEALAIFRQLQLSKNANPNELTFVSTLSSCAQLGAMIHENIQKQRMKMNCHLTTSLIDMYSKCGNLEKALDVFHSVERSDVFVWSSMIAGLAMHGRGRAAIDLFYRMHEAKVKPNAFTFTNVLCACSHSGLVE
ncbi:hypothetical protein Q3G72_034616 [Acer saccharum]|nr:hypothetical protein Q3G72_034616 [Acer saccharum]